MHANHFLIPSHTPKGMEPVRYNYYVVADGSAGHPLVCAVPGAASSDKDAEIAALKEKVATLEQSVPMKRETLVDRIVASATETNKAVIALLEHEKSAHIREHEEDSAELAVTKHGKRLLENELDAKDATISALEAKLARSESEVSSLKATLAEKEKDADEHERATFSRLVMKGVKISSLTTKLEEKEKEIAAMKAENEKNTEWMKRAAVVLAQIEQFEQMYPVERDSDISPLCMIKIFKLMNAVTKPS